MNDSVDKLYPLVFDSIADGVFTVDPQFRITSFNREAERITGLGREEVIGRPCSEVFRASVCAAGCVLRRTLETGEPLRDVRVEVEGARGRRVPIAVSTAVLRDPSGRMVGGVEVFRDLTEVETLRTELRGTAGLGGMVGASARMREIYRILPDVARSDATILLLGASGTGKELLARAIHELSPRAPGPLVRVNCSALPDTLLESELFGFKRGAFTDAKRDKPGRVVQAHGGTILLDEIGDVSPAFQVKLLRVLEDREVFPLGGTASVPVDVRVVAATNRDLKARVEQGLFREDLLYRLRVIQIVLPTLAERHEDVPLLVEHFVRRFAAATGKPVEGVSDEAMEALKAYDFPGNVRELQNALERAFVLCHGRTIELDHLPAEIRAPGTRPAPPPTEANAGPVQSSEAAPSPEAEGLLRALHDASWDRAAAAATLGISRTTLWRRMRALGLTRRR